MQSLIDRLQATLRRRKRLVIGVWVVLLLVALPLSFKQSENLSAGGYVVPGSESKAVNEASSEFANAEPNRMGVLLQVDRDASPNAVRDAVARADEAARKTEHVDLAPGAAQRAEQQAARSETVILDLRTSANQDQAIDAAVDLRKELNIGKQGSDEEVSYYLVGQPALWAGLQDQTKKDLLPAESFGFPVVLIILLAAFGSFVAAMVPLGLGFVSVTLTGAVIYYLSQATDMSVFVTNIASLIGIGVAVDYSLFIVARYRQEVRAGNSEDDAAQIAMRTSGLAVVFSGATVVIAMAGLFLIDSAMLRSMAMGAILVVTISVLGAVLLLPALLATARGRRVHTPGRFVGKLPAALSRLSPGRGDFWGTWTTRVMRRPWLSIAAASVIMLAVAAPTIALETGSGALRQFDKGDDTRVGTELATRQVGEGAAGPVDVVVHGRPDAAALDEYVRNLQRDPSVERVLPPRPSRDGDEALISVVPRDDPESDDTIALVNRLRDGSHEPAGMQMDVGGATALNEDFRELVTGSLWKVLLFVMAATYLILFFLLRSVLLPLKAVIMNALTVAAAYGVIVAVFQWGWLDGITGYDSLGYVNTVTLPFILPIVFGLSMDYEVFLLTRIRERYDATGDNRRAVAEGLKGSAATISSAALIMVAVFMIFVAVSVPSIKEIGLGLAVAIALDATLVRLILVPATMEVLGKWNWWLPRPLERVMSRTPLEAKPMQLRRGHPTHS